ncbi:MAG: hypothetical protein AAFV88_25965, partial [Planctomycetota bacterium]
MKDSLVAPAGLFSPERQRRLLDALISRYQVCSRERNDLIQQHASQREAEEKQLLNDRSGVTADCRQKRRQTLTQWDAAEEDVFAAYEQRTIDLRHKLHRLASLYRKKSTEGQQAIERKVEARRDAVLAQYESRKDQPGIQSRKEIEQINASLQPLHRDLEEARELTVRRLDRLPSVPPAGPGESVDVPATESVPQTVDAVARLTRQSRQLIDEMHSGAAAKFVDSFYLPAGVAIAVVFWSLGVIIARPSAFWLYLVSGVVAAGLIGFAIFAALSIPLRRQTRRLYPMVYRIGEATEQTAAAGKKLSVDQAKATSQELIDRRDQHLRAASAWQQEQLSALETQLTQEKEQAQQRLQAELDQLGDNFHSTWGDVSSKMHQQAESVAGEITQHLAKTDSVLHAQREENASRRKQELERVSRRIRSGLKIGFDRIESTASHAAQRFQSWQQILES